MVPLFWSKGFRLLSTHNFSSLHPELNFFSFVMIVVFFSIAQVSLNSFLKSILYLMELVLYITKGLLILNHQFITSNLHFVHDTIQCAIIKFFFPNKFNYLLKFCLPNPHGLKLESSFMSFFPVLTFQRHVLEGGQSMQPFHGTSMPLDVPSPIKN